MKSLEKDFKNILKSCIKLMNMNESWLAYQWKWKGSMMFLQEKYKKSKVYQI